MCWRASVRLFDEGWKPHVIIKGTHSHERAYSVCVWLCGDGSSGDFFIRDNCAKENYFIDYENRPFRVNVDAAMHGWLKERVDARFYSPKLRAEISTLIKRFIDLYKPT